MTKQRSPEDFIGRFTRSELDRSIGAYSKDFNTPDGKKLIEVALEKARERGSLAVLDGGCGTGRALWELRDQVLFRLGRPSDSVQLSFVGVNRDDYSQESELADVRQSIGKGEIEYRVGELVQTKVEPERYDLITFYEVLIHNSPADSAVIIERHLEGLRPGGWLFATLDRGQYAHPDFKKLIDRVSDNRRWKTNIYEKSTRDGQSRLFFSVNRLSEETK